MNKLINDFDAAKEIMKEIEKVFGRRGLIYENIASYTNLDYNDSFDRERYERKDFNSEEWFYDYFLTSMLIGVREGEKKNNFITGAFPIPFIVALGWTRKCYSKESSLGDLFRKIKPQFQFSLGRPKVNGVIPKREEINIMIAESKKPLYEDYDLVISSKKIRRKEFNPIFFKRALREALEKIVNHSVHNKVTKINLNIIASQRISFLAGEVIADYPYKFGIGHFNSLKNKTEERVVLPLGRIAKFID